MKVRGTRFANSHADEHHEQRGSGERFAALWQDEISTQADKSLTSGGPTDSFKRAKGLSPVDPRSAHAMITAEKLVKLLGLKPHPEGGYYRETYRSDEIIRKRALPERYTGNRRYGTAIYYLLTRETFSAIHRIKTDEIYHFYLGDPVELVQLRPDGSGCVVMLGNDIAGGAQVQAVVPRGAWHGARLAEGGNYALLGTTVSPGFEFADFEIGDRSELTHAYPSFSDAIVALTRYVRSG